MILAFFKLDFYQAFRYNPLIFVLIIFFAVYAIYSLVKYKKIRQMPNKLAIALIIITIMFWILRNISYFDFLAPTIVKY